MTSVLSRLSEASATSLKCSGRLSCPVDPNSAAGSIFQPAFAAAAGRLRSSFGTVASVARSFTSIESVAVIKRAALRVIPLVVVDCVMALPNATPVVPAPPVAPKEPDAEANSEEE